MRASEFTANLQLAPVVATRAKQAVRLGITQSGRPGLFTCGMLAFPLTPQEYADACANPAQLAARCERMGFELTN